MGAGIWNPISGIGLLITLELALLEGPVVLLVPRVSDELNVVDVILLQSVDDTDDVYVRDLPVCIEDDGS